MSITRSIARPITRPLARPLSAAGVGGGFVDIVNNGVLAPFVTFTRASEGTCTGSDGLLKTAAANEPRIDYDPVTLELRGLLVEEQRTNLVLYSHELDNVTVWGNRTSGSGSVPVRMANAGVAPDGTLTAMRLQLSLNGGTSLSDNSGVFQAPSGAIVGNPHTDSVWVKTFDGTTKKIRFDADGAYGNTYTVDGAWRRIEYQWTADVTNRALVIRLRGAQGTSDSADLLVWGAQRELGTFATSYIPTTGTAQTRAIDDPDFTIPAGIVRLNYTYDDNTTADVAVTPGAAYQIPTSQKRIKHLRGYRS